MEIIRDFWGFILSGVAAVAWLVRLESQNKMNASEITRLWRQRSEDLQAHREAREATNALLTELRNDVKILLGRLRD